MKAQGTLQKNKCKEPEDRKKGCEMFSGKDAGIATMIL